MTPNEYQEQAIRTECNQMNSASRMQAWEHGSPTFHPSSIRLNHAILGICNEAGELSKVMIKWIYYGQQFDKTNVIEELGDILWHVAQACTACGVKMEDVMQSNLDKLRVRYPNKFEEYLAAESGRDRQAEVEHIRAGKSEES